MFTEYLYYLFLDAVKKKLWSFFKLLISIWNLRVFLGFIRITICRHLKNTRLAYTRLIVSCFFLTIQTCRKSVGTICIFYYKRLKRKYRRTFFDFRLWYSKINVIKPGKFVNFDIVIRLEIIGGGARAHILAGHIGHSQAVH